MPDNTNNNQGWTPSPWTPNDWSPNPNNPYFNPPPLPPMNFNYGGGNYNPPPERGPGSGGGGYRPPPDGPGVKRQDAGIVGTPGGTPEGANRGEVISQQTGPNFGANNTTMPGMFSPTGVGNQSPLPQPRQILYDKLYRTLGG